MATIQLWVKIRPEQDGDLWSAYCDELGLGSCGRSEKEAESNLKDAISVLCYALERRGLLEKRLKEKGIHYEIVTPKIEEGEELKPVLV